MHSKQFEKIKRYYDEGFWNDARVRNAVVKGWITEEEFTEITEEPVLEANETEQEQEEESSVLGTDEEGVLGDYEK